MMMTDEEKKAWDGFAAGALIPMIDYALKGNHSCKATCSEAAIYADEMMEQRKARMGWMQ